MARRPREDGPSLESDSFLDIVANLVGIVIVLIVIVGVRVGQNASDEAQQADPAPIAIAPAPPTVVPAVAPRPVIVRLAPRVLPAPEPDAKLLASIDSASRDASSLRDERAALATELGRLDSALANAASGAESATAAQLELTGRLTAIEREGHVVTAQLDDLRSTLAGLGRQISDVPSEKVTVLKHKLNPIGREVQGKELHFRLAEGRVSRVPIEELIERLKPQIEKQKEWIARYQRHQGELGPVDGYTMTYVVERQRMSVVEELKLGVQMMRIVVSKWEVAPGPGVIAETVDDALRSDSRFLSALRLADPGTTLTLWVYPDSFDAYHRLQAFAQSEGFSVAARPLPKGVPIAGSPNGSRSTSQ